MKSKDNLRKSDVSVSVNILHAQIEALVYALGRHNPAILRDFETKLNELMMSKEVYIPDRGQPEELVKEYNEWHRFMKQMNM